MDREIAETNPFQPVADDEEGGQPDAKFDATIDTGSRPVAVSADANGIAVLSRLLEGKRGPIPSFETVKTLAQGGMGAVLIAQDNALQRRIAVKVMKPEIAESDDQRARFLEEAQVTGQLEHPNIVPIHDLGKDADDNLYFTMKLVKGQSLGQILANMKQDTLSGRSLTELLNIVLKIADGLAFAHSKGVVHRDLKPDNIMVGDFGEVFIMDWGLAKLLGRNMHGGSSPVPVPADAKSDTADNALEQTIQSIRTSESIGQTVDGTIQGTPSYMPPEQAQGQVDKIDQRSDIYSLGAILYEILTLEPPVEGKTFLDVVMNAAEGKVIPPEQRAPKSFIPAELSAVAMKALQTSREERYQTVKELERDIHLFLEGRAVSAKPDSPLESFIKLIRRNKAVSSAIAVAATIILVLATVSYVRISRERDRALDNERTAVKNEQRAVRGESLARVNEQKARASEEKAVDAQRRQRETALAASKQFALQAGELANVNRLEPAQRRAQDAAIVAPNGPWEDFASGAIAMAQQDYPGAAELYRTAMSKQDGDQPEIRAALADALARQGKLEEAEEVLVQLDKIHDWRILLSAGRALYTAHNWDACQKPLSRAIELMEREKDRPNSSLAEAKRLLEAAPAQLACEGFYDEIRNLPFAQQQKRVVEKLAEIHHGRVDRGSRLIQIDGELSFSVGTTDYRPRHIYPLRGLPIVDIWLYGSSVWDLSPFVGMPIRYLNANGCRSLTDLGPLSKCNSLTSLHCASTGIRDLATLKGLKLRQLVCDFTEIRDLSPLARMPLKKLGLTGTQIADLSPLVGCPVEYLDLRMTRVKDLSPLAGMPLKHLDLNATRAEDLSPLRDASLEYLDIYGTGVSDLSPLAGMPLKHLNLNGTNATDLSALRDAPLEYLDLAKTGVTDLSALRDAPLEYLNVGRTGVSDLAVLAGMPLTYLDCAATNVADLAPLAGAQLTFLRLKMTDVSDLSPLAGMPLTYLNLTQTNVTDLSPLKGAPLPSVGIFGCWIKDYSPLKSLPDLELARLPEVPFLLGEITEQELLERYQEQHTDLAGDDVSKRVLVYIAMKRYANDGPAAALRVLEKYVEKFGTAPPDVADNVTPDFIELQLARLRDELAAQPDQPGPDNAAP